jgi:hypothetical protein
MSGAQYEADSKLAEVPLIIDKLHGFAGGNCIPLSKHKTPFNEISHPAQAVMVSERKEYAFRRMQDYKQFSNSKASTRP